jgi:hypothetical protein
LAWAYWVRLEGPALVEKGKNPVGIARASWRRGDGPGGGLVDLARIWLRLDDDGRSEFIEAGQRSQYRSRINLTLALEELGVSERIMTVFGELWAVTAGDVAPGLLLPDVEDMESD